MKEYGDVQSWTKLAIIPFHPQLVNLGSPLQSLYISESGELLHNVRYYLLLNITKERNLGSDFIKKREHSGGDKLRLGFDSSTRLHKNSDNLIRIFNHLLHVSFNYVNLYEIVSVH
ncbi:hypothetical protein AHAS_Ahas18G0266300 [Arachis hypogaea]